jgi:hypothetical protein
LDPLGEGNVAHAVLGLEEVEEADDRLDRFFFDGDEVGGVLKEGPFLGCEVCAAVVEPGPWPTAALAPAPMPMPEPNPKPIGDC